MKTRLAIALIGAVLAGASLAAHADGRGRDWDDHGSRQRDWGHDDRHWQHHDWRPAPRWHDSGPAYRGYGGYGGYPPPYAEGRDGLTIILRGHLP
jgi:hypothetical protein